MSLLLVESARDRRCGGVSWMIDVPVVRYFGLTEVCRCVSIVDASPSNESFVD